MWYIVFNIAKNSKYDGYKGSLFQWLAKFLIKSLQYSQINLRLLVVLLQVKLCQTNNW